MGPGGQGRSDRAGGMGGVTQGRGAAGDQSSKGSGVGLGPHLDLRLRAGLRGQGAWQVSHRSEKAARAQDGPWNYRIQGG